jgi:hypothetical protein
VLIGGKVHSVLRAIDCADLFGLRRAVGQRAGRYSHTELCFYSKMWKEVHTSDCIVVECTTIAVGRFKLHCMCWIEWARSCSTRCLTVCMFGTCCCCCCSGCSGCCDAGQKDHCIYTTGRAATNDPRHVDPMQLCVGHCAVVGLPSVRETHSRASDFDI